MRPRLDPLLNLTAELRTMTCLRHPGRRRLPMPHVSAECSERTAVLAGTAVGAVVSRVPGRAANVSARRRVKRS